MRCSIRDRETRRRLRIHSTPSLPPSFRPSLQPYRATGTEFPATVTFSHTIFLRRNRDEDEEGEEGREDEEEEPTRAEQTSA